MYDEAEVVRRSGIPADVARRLWRALGFPDVPPGERAFTDADVEALSLAGAALENGALSIEELLQLTRVMASSVARIAETQVEMAASRGSAGPAATEALEQTPRLLEYMWRRHLEAAARRVQSTEGGGHPSAVGFADLVGFTALSQQLGDRELAELVDRFDGLSHDAVVSHGGRVVKMIGDEVMFAVDELRPAADLALDLVETYAGEEQLSDVRVGLAWGNVVSREGDLFGPTVNLASRIVNIARPGSVVVGPEVREQLEGEEGLRFRAMRPRTLKGIGRVPLAVLRRA